MKFFLNIIKLLALAIAPPSTLALAVSIQFFGDVFLPSPENADLTIHVRPLLDAATFNIVNFEGVATEAFVPLEPKNFLLRMPLTVANQLRTANISGVTLANNHSMDFGRQGLHDTLRTLDDAGIAHSGAGMTLAQAQTPILIGSHGLTACIAAFSRTFPSSFWAKENSPGTAYASTDSLISAIKTCKTRRFFTVIAFHWGKEGITTPSDYQRILAHRAIDAGADAVVGHHPHVIQDIEVYKGKPIFYSLGNFLFGSMPTGSTPSGLAVRVTLPNAAFGPPAATQWDLTALNVDNRKVRFRPRPIADKTTFHPSIKRLAAAKICAFRTDPPRWSCQFD